MLHIGPYIKKPAKILRDLRKPTPRECRLVLATLIALLPATARAIADVRQHADVPWLNWWALQAVALVVAVAVAGLRPKRRRRPASEGGRKRTDPWNLLLYPFEEECEESAVLGTLKAIAASVEARDRFSYGHGFRVRTLAVRIAEECGLTPEEIDEVRRAALLHDIGKLGVPDSVLLKPGPLSVEERDRVALHVHIGWEILHHVPELEKTALHVLHHHERFDGSGYPLGLKGEEIPIVSRIIAVADAIDAMRSERPYRPALSREEMEAELRKASGTQFDPMVVEAALRVTGARAGSTEREVAETTA